MLTIAKITPLILLVSTFFVYPENTHAQDRVRLITRLNNPTIQARGKAKFEERDDRRRFSAEFRDPQGAGANYEVCLIQGGNKVILGTVQSDATGFADFNIDDRDGFSVPRMKVDDEVQIFRFGKVKILNGKLRMRN